MLFRSGVTVKRGTCSAQLADCARMSRRARAFSLIEVIAAVGIFSMGVVSLVALFGAQLRPLMESEDGAIAASLMAPLRVELRRQIQAARSLAPVRVLIRSTAARDGPPQLLLAPRDGTFVADEHDERWTVSRAKPYFAIALLPNASLPYGEETDSPEGITFTAEFRWPALVTSAKAGTEPPWSAATPDVQSHLRLNGALGL